MRILLWNRRTGKTNECIELMREDPDVICLVSSVDEQRNNYPVDLRNRVFISSSLKWRGMRDKKMILDNVDLMEEIHVQIASDLHEIILVTITPNSWLLRAVQRHGFNARETPHGKD